MLPSRTADDVDPEVFSSSSAEMLQELLRNMFLFSIVWTAGGLLERSDRQRFDAWIRSKAGSALPALSDEPDDSIFLWTFDTDALQWQRILVPDFAFPKQVSRQPCAHGQGSVAPDLSTDPTILTIGDCSQIASTDMTVGPDGVVGAFDASGLLVPTIDSVQAKIVLQVCCGGKHIEPWGEQRRTGWVHGRCFVTQVLHGSRYSSLLVGSPGSGKSSTMMMFLDSLNPDRVLVKKFAFSSATTPGKSGPQVVRVHRPIAGVASLPCDLADLVVVMEHTGMFQASIDSELDRRGGKNYGPPPGKTMTVFLDDLSMPEPNMWGDQPTLELVRQLVEMHGMYFLTQDRRGEIKSIEDLQVSWSDFCKSRVLCMRSGNRRCQQPSVNGVVLPWSSSRPP